MRGPLPLLALVLAASGAGAATNAELKEEQAKAARLEVVPDLDMAGARGAAIAALEGIHGR